MQHHGQCWKKNIGWIVDSNLKDFEVTLKKFSLELKRSLEIKSINAINFSKEYYWDNLKTKYIEK